jgi:hypothetical protein
MKVLFVTITVRHLNGSKTIRVMYSILCGKDLEGGSDEVIRVETEEKQKYINENIRW